VLSFRVPSALLVFDQYTVVATRLREDIQAEQQKAEETCAPDAPSQSPFTGSCISDRAISYEPAALSSGSD